MTRHDTSEVHNLSVRTEVNSPSFPIMLSEFISLQLTVQLATAIIGFILDILVFTLTFAKTIHHAKGMRNAGLGSGLGYFILRDGSINTDLTYKDPQERYIFCSLHFSVFKYPDGTIGEWGVLSNLLINRLVLNLRRVSHLQVGNASTIGTIREPVFATNSFLGNLGAPLRVGSDDDDGIEELCIDDETEVVEESRIVDRSDTIKDIRDPSDGVYLLSNIADDNRVSVFVSNIDSRESLQLGFGNERVAAYDRANRSTANWAWTSKFSNTTYRNNGKALFLEETYQQGCIASTNPLFAERPFLQRRRSQRSYE
ncbi:hypothetical protein BD410DRAFT_830798 [Rickenella mellea]|uniref:Uncharacterized protein n=1 Tax=Rickenella mellea TaxID=50990 RepID=A0A4Y7PU82_9AGAM|nr:hypothetical protein BD410DRAFT_830798 [Rickenella mellea]